MNAATCRCVILLSLVCTATIVIPVQATSAGRSESAKPAKPKHANPDEPQRGMGAADRPGQMPGPGDPTRIVEERLRRGEMDQPIAQGQISDRLEQLHRGAAEHSTGESAAGPRQ